MRGLILSAAALAALALGGCNARNSPAPDAVVGPDPKLPQARALLVADDTGDTIWRVTAR